MKKALLLTAVFAILLTGCADSGVIAVPPEPGFVGIDDRAATAFPPLLTVTYIDIGGRNVRVEIVSEIATDGHVSFDPVRGVHVSTIGPDFLFFGVDSFDPNRREFRAFLDFPLDGTTGQDSVPSGVPIVSAGLRIFVTEVSFAPVVPSFIDLVTYPLSGPGRDDFDSTPLAFLTFDFFDTDAGRVLDIDVTQLMDRAQRDNLGDFQVRFMIQ